jgi:hypothetical protein
MVLFTSESRAIVSLKVKENENQLNLYLDSPTFGKALTVTSPLTLSLSYTTHRSSLKSLGDFVQMLCGSTIVVITNLAAFPSISKPNIFPIICQRREF